KEQRTRPAKNSVSARAAAFVAQWKRATPCAVCGPLERDLSRWAGAVPGGASAGSTRSRQWPATVDADPGGTAWLPRTGEALSAGALQLFFGGISRFHTCAADLPRATPAASAAGVRWAGPGGGGQRPGTADRQGNCSG